MTEHSALHAIHLSAQRPIAVHSPDHLQPWGTKRDNSRNRRFNHKLYKLFGNRQIAVLGLGCSGGGFVRDCLDDGHLAIGLEGSDYSKRTQRAEWATIPDFLFTCDVTAPFSLTINDAQMHFDAITSWELIEHIAEQDLQTVADNVGRHLAPGGIWIMSVSPNEDIIGGVRLHQSVFDRQWWLKTFSRLGWHNHQNVIDYFATQFIRGPKFGAPGSFHLALARTKAAFPVPSLRFTERIFDSWNGSKWQRLLQRIVNGQ